jgi:hypothetical protein
MYNRNRNTIGVADVETKMAYFKSIYANKFGAQFGKLETEEEIVNRLRVIHQNMANDEKGSTNYLATGVNLAAGLQKACHVIEAWRMFKELITISQQIHGKDHCMTKKLEAQCKECKTAYVYLIGNSKEELFEALRYEGDKCILRGPVKEARAEDQEKTITVDTSNILLPEKGIAVVCRGLKNASDLNGKIGDLRSFHPRTQRYEVHFEDKSIQPKRVKLDNLRILFELPGDN